MFFIHSLTTTIAVAAAAMVGRLDVELTQTGHRTDMLDVNTLRNAPLGIYDWHLYHENQISGQHRKVNFYHSTFFSYNWLGIFGQVFQRLGLSRVCFLFVCIVHNRLKLSLK